MSDPLFGLQLGLRYLHIFGAIILFGGSIFALFGVSPALAVFDSTTRGKLHEEIRLRWRWFAHASVTALLVSGIANLGLAPRYAFEGPWSMLGGIKMLLALPVFFIAMLLTGSSAASRKFREKSHFWLTVNVVLGTIIVLIGGFMRYIPRELKVKAAAPPTVNQPVEPATDKPVNP